jgi:hypothetical protein
MKRFKARREQFLRVASLATVAWALILQAGLANGPPAVVDPPAVDETMAPTYDILIEKTVQTPDIPPRPDIVFLSDTTGSMGDAIANVQDNIDLIMADVEAGTTGTPFFAAAQYRDEEQYGSLGPLFQVDQGLTDNQAAVSAAVSGWSANSGGDEPEAQLNALYQLATGAVSYRDQSTSVIVWFGDAPGHDPSNGNSEVDATNALNAANDGDGIIVIAIDIETEGNSGLDGTAGGTVPGGQGTRIADATGGELIPDASPDEVSDAILAALQNLPITVVPVAVGCDPLVVTFSPTSQTVTSGDPAVFDETITVPADASVAGQTVECTVEFRDEFGNVLVVGDEEAIQAITVDIPLAIDLDPDTKVNELSEDNAHTVTAYVSSLDVPLGLGGKTVQFEVTGTNPGYGASTTTDDDGVATFGYSVPISCNSLGTDTITGCTNRADSPDLFETCDEVTKDWVDTIPPVAECVPTENPHGDTEPTAPGEGEQGQNQDGFYQLLATDNLVDGCAPLDLFVEDTGSGAVFGPFGVGTKIKYIEDPDAVPEIAAMGGNNGNGKGKSKDTDWRIKGTGDAVLTAVDQSGNVSAPVNCLVPPPPQ